MKLKGKVAVITGGSMGIGEALARLFAIEGATVVLTSRDLARAEAARQRIGFPERSLAVVCDVRRRSDLEVLAHTSLQRFGRIDIWVNNAGHGLLDSVEKMEPANYRDLFETNLFGAIEGMQVAIAQMRKQGSGAIINISSVAGSIAVPFSVAYSASKAALNAIGRGAALELRKSGIHVMTVCPGYIATDFPINATRGTERLRLSPAQPKNRGVPASVVADATLKGYLKQKMQIVVPAWYRLVIGLYRTAPALVDWWMMRKLGPADEFKLKNEED